MIRRQLWSTPARRRMSALATAAALFALVNSAFDVVAPLWAAGDLGLDAAGWARLRSLRMTGTFAGILVLGMAAERVGSRRMAAISLAGAALALAAMAGSGARAVAWLFPVFGALVSAAYVNFNALTQRVSATRQGLANSLYRGVGSAMAIVAPALATGAASRLGAYAPVLAAAAMVMGLAAAAILAYPEAPVATERTQLRAAVAGYQRAFAHRGLLAFVLLEQLWWCSQAAVGTFAALRFTRQLGMSEPAFGLLCTTAGAFGLLVTLASGVLVERWPLSRVLASAWVACCLAAVALGGSGTLGVSIAAFLVWAPLAAMTAVPTSIWVGRTAVGASPATAFTVHKIAQSGMIALAMALLGLLEPLVGMAALIWGGGLLGLPLAVVMLRLRPPAAP